MGHGSGSEVQSKSKSSSRSKAGIAKVAKISFLCSWLRDGPLDVSAQDPTAAQSVGYRR